MKAQKVDIQTDDAFNAETQLLTLDAVVFVSIVTGTIVRAKFKPNKSTPEAIANAIGGSIINT